MDLEKTTNGASPEDGSHSSDDDIIPRSLPVGGSPPHKQPPPSPPPSSTKPPLSLFHEILLIPLLCTAQLLTQAGLGQTLAPLPLISPSFSSPSPPHLAWFIAGYSLTVGTFILLAGRAGDILGHKRLFIAGYIWYGIWSVVAGLSVYTRSVAFFVVCRAMQGIGPAVLLPNALAIMGRLYPPGRRKDMVFSLFGATAPNGFLVGAAFSSLLAERVWWPWGYHILGIVCFLLAVFSIGVIPPMPGQSSPIKLSHFDPIGSLLGISGLILFNIAWNQAPISSWSSPLVLTTLLLGLLLLTLFIYFETLPPSPSGRGPTNPLLPRKALTLPSTTFLLACLSLGWSSFGIWIFYFWSFISSLRHISPLEGTLQVLPAGISGFLAALTTGHILLSRLPASYIMLFALLAFFTGNTLLAFAPVGQTYWTQTFLSIVITPWGMDMSFPAGTVILSNLMATTRSEQEEKEGEDKQEQQQQQGVAASLVNTVVNYSISIGLGIAGTVEGHINHGGRDLERGYRGAWYTGMGLSGLGVGVAGMFVFVGERKRWREKGRRIRGREREREREMRDET